MTIASNTAAAITTIAGADFSVSVNNDILTITNTTLGEVTDADDVNTPFVVDVINQGKSGAAGTSSSVEGPIIDERVYIIYGDEDFYSESVRTDENGKYQFKGLQKGNYRIYAFSEDTLSLTGTLMQVEVNAEIKKNKEVVEAPELYIVH